VKNRTLTFIICLFASTNLLGQTGKFYSPDKEISNSLINKVFQDKRGYVWIATENGLNKFDGIKFTIYKHSPDDSASLIDNYVRTVFEDSGGNFWVGCVNGLMRYDRAVDSFEEIKMYKENKAVSPHVTCIMETRAGDLLIATSGQGLFEIRKGTDACHIKNELSGKLNSIYLNLVFEDKQGNIWIGSENNGLNLYSPSTGKVTTFVAPNGISSNNISSIAEDKPGNIFAGTLTQGLNRYDERENVFRQVKYRENQQLMIKTLYLSKDNVLYIGTDGQGMKIFEHENNEVKDYEIRSAPFDFSTGKLHSIMQDENNNFWLGIFQKGVIFIPEADKKFDYIGFKSIKSSPIGSSAVMSIFKDNEDITWIGTDNDGLYGLNTHNEQIAHFYPAASFNSVSNIILSIFEDSENNLWLGSYTKGLALLNRKTGQCEYVPELLNEKIYSIAEDNEKNLLVGTYGSGFYKVKIADRSITGHYESMKRENDDFTIDELSNDWINDILFDSEGLIWLAHYKGVSCYDRRKNTFINYLKQNTLIHKTVAYTIFEDESGKIWIGTSEGLYSFDKTDESLKYYSSKDGLPNNVICGIMEDENHDIWVSTYLGISKFDVSANKFVNYYAGDGLQGNEFTRGARFKDKNGKMYFGGIYGITCFYPQQITETKKRLKVYITDFYVFNNPVRKGDKSGNHEIIKTSVSEAGEFSLTHDDNTFSIEFSTFEYANPERIVYQYKIEELEEQWINTYPSTNRVTYTNLNPGSYTFKVRAMDNENTSEIKTVKILISPPWYGSMYACIAYIILIILFLFFAFNFIRSRYRQRQDTMRIRRQEEINEAKLQFFTNISHEIRTPMTMVISPLEKLISENGEPEQQKTYQMIYRNAQRILRLINQLMDVRKLDKGQMKLHFVETDIVGFIKDMMLTFEYPSRKKNIQFDFIHSVDSLNVWIDRNNFDKILLNILSNAFKYTPDNGNIAIELHTGSNENAKGALKKYFEIDIIDSGIGIDEDKIEQIFERFYQINSDLINANFGTGIGLHLARSLVTLHHGVIYAENRKETQGARFVVTIPLGCNHLKIQELEGKTPTENVNILNMNEIVADISDTKSPATPVVKPKTKYKILIVDDEAEIREYIKSELSGEYKVIESSNGKKALEMALQESPHLIISDIMMPEMDGITFSQKMKQNININHIPIILLSAKTASESKIEGLETGADAYITKPFNTDYLKSTIANLIENRTLLKNKFSGKQQPVEMMEKIEMRSADEALMQKVMKVINENMSNPDFSVEHLAEKVGISRVHIYRRLKELTNQSAHNFIKGIRLQQAATLLLSKKYSISEVAYATGFSNPSHFSNSFREFYGVSPKEYIRKSKR
jgi:signal transduction histidine kinase/ligand-binding sensor domain-containing protein/DNA-binding response OmpR family regulator